MRDEVEQKFIKELREEREAMRAEVEKERALLMDQYKKLEE